MHLLKRIFFIILFLSIFITPHVYADTPTPTPAINCGFAGDPNASKCCEDSFDVQKINQGVQGPMDKAGLGLAAPILNGLIGTLGGAGDEVMKQVHMDQVIKKCYVGNPDSSSGSCVCTQTNQTGGQSKKTLDLLCSRYASPEEKDLCDRCAKADQILTGFGCIPLSFGNFVSDFLLGRLIGLAGILGILCIIYSAFILQTSRGNPEKIKRAQEMMTSCIMGLMLIIFSVFILRVIGISILKLPGFGQ